MAPGRYAERPRPREPSGTSRDPVATRPGRSVQHHAAEPGSDEVPIPGRPLHDPANLPGDDRPPLRPFVGRSEVDRDREVDVVLQEGVVELVLRTVENLGSLQEVDVRGDPVFLDLGVGVGRVPVEDGVDPRPVERTMSVSTSLRTTVRSFSGSLKVIGWSGLEAGSGNGFLEP